MTGHGPRVAVICYGASNFEAFCLTRVGVAFTARDYEFNERANPIRLLSATRVVPEAKGFPLLFSHRRCYIVK